MNTFGAGKWIGLFPGLHLINAVAVNSQTAMLQRIAEAIGCLVAPLPIVGVVVVESIFHNTFDVGLFIIFSLITYSFALGFTVVLGYPIFRLLLRIGAVFWWTSMVSGFLIGALATILIGHPTNIFSSGVLINSLASSISGLLFWIIQSKGFPQERGWR